MALVIRIGGVVLALLLVIIIWTHEEFTQADNFPILESFDGPIDQTTAERFLATEDWTGMIQTLHSQLEDSGILITTEGITAPAYLLMALEEILEYPDDADEDAWRGYFSLAKDELRSMTNRLRTTLTEGDAAKVTCFEIVAEAFLEKFDEIRISHELIGDFGGFIIGLDQVAKQIKKYGDGFSKN